MTTQVLLLCASILGSDPGRGDDIPTYEKHIAPFFKTYCVGCHDGGDDSKAGLSLLSHKDLMAGGDSGEVIVAGKSGESRLVGMLVGTVKPRMPPKDSKQPQAEEIELVKRWVDLGAKAPTSAAPQSADELTLPRIEPKTSVSPAVSSVRYTPDGRHLVAARHREVLLIDSSTGRVVQTLDGADNPVNAVAASPDGKLIAAAEGFPSVAGKVRLWEAGTGEVANAVGSANESKSRSASRTFTGHTDSIYALAFSPDGTQLVTGSYDKLLILWDVATGAQKHTLKHHTGAVFGVAFSPDGNALASVAADQTVKLWNVATGQRILTLIEPTKGLYAVAFHPQGRELAAAGMDKMIRVYEWNGTAANLKRSAFAHDAPILSLAYSPDGATLFSASEDRRVKAWDVAALRERHVYERLPDWPLALAVHPGGGQLAVGSFDGALSIFDSKGPTRLRDGISAAVHLLPPLGRGGRGGALDRGQRSEARSQRSGGGGAVLPLIAAFFGQQPAPTEQTEEKPNPPAPRFDSVSPRTVVRGSKIKFTLSGRNIADADRIEVSGKLQATLLPPDPKKADQAFCEIDIPADLPPGVVSVRLHTPLGSAGTRSFYVGPFSEMSEKEENGVREKATPASLPATLTGTIGSRGDRDLWSFEARAGEECVFVLFGSNLGSTLQARLSLIDESGGVVRVVVRDPARGEVVLGHKFETAGRFFLQVEDRDNAGTGNHFYAIHAGSFPYVSGVWPLGMRAADQGQSAAGEVTAVDLSGFNLLPGTKLRPTPGSGARSVAPFAAAGKTVNTARYEASAFPEFVENEANDTPQQAQAVPVPSAVSGRIGGKKSEVRDQTSEVRASSPPLSKGGPGGVATQESEVRDQRSEVNDSDHFSFTAKRGDRLMIETFARRLGSPVDTVLDILDAQGRPVPRATLRAVAETYAVLRDHDSKQKGMRLQNWDDLQPNDYVMAGGEIVRVQSLPLGPDADVQFADRNGSRLGFLGTTPEAHALNSAVYKVEIHPSGMTFPPNGMPVVSLDWRNDDAHGLQGDSQVLFDVPADGAYIVRVRDVRELAGDDFVYRLVIRPRHEDFRISLDPENPNVPRGGSMPVTINVERVDGFTGPVDVRLENLSEGITATTTRIGPERFSGILTLTAAENAPPQPPLGRGGQGGSRPTDAAAPTGASASATTDDRRADASRSPGSLAAATPLRVIGTATIGDKIVERATSPGFGTHEITVTSPPDLKVTVEPTFAEIAPGQELRFTVTIARKNAFKGRVPVDVMNLPHGLRVLDVGLNGVLINEDETSRSFVLTCDPWAEPGSVLFYAAGRVEAKTERHAAPGIRLEVRVPQVATK